MGYHDVITVPVFDKKCCSIRTMMVYGKTISSLVSIRLLCELWYLHLG